MSSRRKINFLISIVCKTLLLQQVCILLITSATAWNPYEEQQQATYMSIQKRNGNQKQEITAQHPRYSALRQQEQQHQQQQQQQQKRRQHPNAVNDDRRRIIETQQTNETTETIWVPIGLHERYPWVSKIQDDIQNQLTLIKVCAPGYSAVRWRGSTLCRPHCDNCQNGYCKETGECQCYEEFVRNDNGDCVFACPLGCLNGRCYLDGSCLCDPGYKLDESRRFCRPICSLGCGNSLKYNCTEPEICGCARGYRLTEYGCQPSCQPDCGIGGVCRENNQCECGPGYRMKNNVCQSDCYQNCSYGICYSRNRCICNPGYTYHERTSRCVPIMK